MCHCVTLRGEGQTPCVTVSPCGGRDRLHVSLCHPADGSVCGGNWICPSDDDCSGNKSGCHCRKGYVTEGSGRENFCDDINECLFGSPCGAIGDCINVVGGFHCMCATGFRSANNVTQFCPNKTRCVDIDECSHTPPPCDHTAICTNTPGRFSCNCPPGYIPHNSIKQGNHVTSCTEVKGTCESHFTREKKELEKCETQNQKDPFCSILNSTFHLLDSSCQGKDIFLEGVIQAFSQVLNQSYWSNLTSPQLRVAVTALLESVESAALLSLTQNPRNQRVSTPEIELDMKVSRDNCSTETPSLHLNVGGNSMVVPCVLVSGHQDGAVFISYTNFESFLTGSLLLPGEYPGQFRDAVVYSQVVTGAITSNKTKHLNPPVTFNLQHLQVPEPSLTPLCVFWDGGSGGWSRIGCDTQHSNVTHTVCACSHLSSFAVIMAHSDIQEDSGLTWLSRIGLSVSLLCLSLSLLTFLLCRALRSAHTSVLTILCGCLFLGQLLFLVGVQQTGNKTLCSVIAGGLHLLFLCAFCWMSLESALLFLTVRHLRAVNYLTTQRSHFPSACLVGFGVPVVIIIISAATRPDEYGTARHCWLDQRLIWSFIGPINTTLLILTFWLLRVRLSSLNTNVSTLKDTRLMTFKALAQLVILGSTWSIGLFQFGPGALVISYIFTVCNSLQGAFIFLVHCLLNRQVREEYRKAFRRLIARKSESEVASGSTIPMAMKSSDTLEAAKPDVVAHSCSAN
ncbi:adhesion G protein-coupled receptor E3-like isoform X1 [Ascaphus truei]|uniref:adhesion G protein-coupled receptor E3-like isoform X1 n=1 Tax=Ascaphus truei TaxID=8439 RepID=UPI003F59A8C3